MARDTRAVGQCCPGGSFSSSILASFALQAYFNIGNTYNFNPGLASCHQRQTQYIKLLSQPPVQLSPFILPLTAHPPSASFPSKSGTALPHHMLSSVLLDSNPKPQVIRSRRSLPL